MTTCYECAMYFVITRARKLQRRFHAHPRLLSRTTALATTANHVKLNCFPSLACFFLFRVSRLMRATRRR